MTRTCSAGGSGSTCRTRRCTATSRPTSAGGWSSAIPTLRRHSPLFGEHTREVLTGVAGLTDAEVDSLYAAQVTADDPINPYVG